MLDVDAGKSVTNGARVARQRLVISDDRLAGAVNMENKEKLSTRLWRKGQTKKTLFRVNDNKERVKSRKKKTDHETANYSEDFSIRHVTDGVYFSTSTVANSDSTY